MILNNFMREFADSSIKDWVAFIKSFTVPKGNELWELSKEALLCVKLEILKPSIKDDKKKRNKTVKKTSDIAEEEEEPVDDTAKRIRY